MNGVEQAMRDVLAGPIDRAIVLPHRTLKFFAQNHEGHTALVVKVTLAADQTVTDGRGFSVKTVRGGDDNFVRLTSTAPGISLVFLKLVELILDRTDLATTQADAVRVLIDAIHEFRAFGGRTGNRLTENEVRGTLAELIVLQGCLSGGADPLVALTAWRGPFSLAGIGNHDFVSADGSGMEVKSVRQGALEVAVSSTSQLVPTSAELDLLVLPLERAPRGINFRTYALELEDRLRSEGEACRLAWADALAALGLDLEDEWYDQYRFLPGIWRRFRVTDGFPHIAPESVPAGITRVRYSLTLAQLTPFEAQARELIQELGC